MHARMTIAGLAVALALLVVACGDDTSSGGDTCTVKAPAKAECRRASAEVRAAIRDGLNHGAKLVELRALRAQEFERAYYLAARIRVPGVGVEQALWVVSGTLSDPGIFQAVDGMAKEFSDYPDASKTDSRASVADDGAQAALGCVS